MIAGLKNRSVVADPAALSVFPIRPVGLRDAIARAMRYEDRAFALTRWSDARSSGGEPLSLAETRFGSKLVDARQIHVDVDADRAFVPIAKIGGDRGWYYATWLWRIRGAIDLLMGGVGMRRGRRDPLGQRGVTDEGRSSDGSKRLDRAAAGHQVCLFSFVRTHGWPFRRSRVRRDLNVHFTAAGN